MNRLNISSVYNLGTILFKQHDLISTAFTYLITDGQKLCLDIEEVRSKNYHVMLNTV
jgi:hypothetical protein